ncbi:MAG: pyridoxal phosphate-dependent aminotransferase [bacterium]
MRFDTIPYMEWAKVGADYVNPDHLNLASSGMPPLVSTLADLGVDAGDMPLSGSHSYGYPPLREALAERYGVHQENVLIAQGTSMANFLVMAVQVNPGDVLLVETPVYECISYPARALGARIVPFERREEDRWKLNIEEMVSLAYATGACGIVLSNPHNPTGAFTSDADLQRLANGAGKERFVLVDEVYREGRVNQAGRTCAMKAPNLYITSSLTKVWGFGDLRAGWAIAAHDVIRAAYRAYDHLGVINPFPMEWLAHQIITREDLIGGIRERALALIDEARTHINRFLAKRATGKRIRSVMPEGGGFAAWRIDGINGDTLMRQLYEEEGVIVVSGSFFGSPAHIRISWTAGTEAVVQGLHRIDRWLSKNG